MTACFASSLPNPAFSVFAADCGNLQQASPRRSVRRIDAGPRSRNRQTGPQAIRQKPKINLGDGHGSWQAAVFHVFLNFPSPPIGSDVAENSVFHKRHCFARAGAKKGQSLPAPLKGHMPTGSGNVRARVNPRPRFPPKPRLQLRKSIGLIDCFGVSFHSLRRRLNALLAGSAVRER